ncbi:hypothetical protein E5D57_008524 [Metarhizium anisopliae]|nr:hypothetical protein E5D57_008524 [Metarhizium anisopliae]
MAPSSVPKAQNEPTYRVFSALQRIIEGKLAEWTTQMSLQFLRSPLAVEEVDAASQSYSQAGRESPNVLHMRPPSPSDFAAAAGAGVVGGRLIASVAASF